MPDRTNLGMPSMTLRRATCGRPNSRILFSISIFIVIALLRPAIRYAADPAASLDRGYRSMYGLKFDDARREFSQWEFEHPGDPLGSVSEAANILFAEFDRLGILESQFYVEDSYFRSHDRREPDKDSAARFETALSRAEEQARAHLAGNDRDRDALFALALVFGLRADRAALIDKRNMAALRFTREASETADRLLAFAPDYYDAYLATGASKYIVGSVVAPVRWVLGLAGYRGDKQGGIDQVKLTAEKGRLLAPYARILLAIAYVREGNKPEARKLLAGLRDEFPSNPLFAREADRIDKGVNPGCCAERR